MLGCGIVGRLVASDAICHQLFIIEYILKDENKQKEAWNGPFKKYDLHLFIILNGSYNLNSLHNELFPVIREQNKKCKHNVPAHLSMCPWSSLHKEESLA